MRELLAKRIAELSAHQAEIQERADKEKAAVQEQINALIEAHDMLEKDPQVEAVYLKLAALKLIGD